MNRKRLFTALYGLVCLGLAWPAFSQEREFTQKIWPDAPPGGPASTAAESVTNRGHEQNERGLNRSTHGCLGYQRHITIQDQDHAISV